MRGIFANLDFGELLKFSVNISSFLFVNFDSVAAVRDFRLATFHGDIFPRRRATCIANVHSTAKISYSYKSFL